MKERLTDQIRVVRFSGLGLEAVGTRFEPRHDPLLGYRLKKVPFLTFFSYFFALFEGLLYLSPMRSGVQLSAMLRGYSREYWKAI